VNGGEGRKKKLKVEEAERRQRREGQRLKISPWTSWHWDFQRPANLACQKIRDFAVAGDRFAASG
jgi:hypothetical protein